MDDEAKYAQLINSKSLVIAANVASENLPYERFAKYVVHNFDRMDFENKSNVLKLQVYTHAAYGEELGHSYIKYDSSSRTLFQPWGVAEPHGSWLQSKNKIGNIEYWIGAVWNNSLNQGNSDQIQLYVDALRQHGIRFRRVGGTRWLTKSGVSPNRAQILSNRSPVGAAIVGAWQMEAGYIPCRIFKNVAAGNTPISNSNFDHVFNGVGIYEPDIPQLILKALEVNRKKPNSDILTAQEAMKLFSYEKGIRRIIDSLP